MAVTHVNDDGLGLFYFWVVGPFVLLAVLAVSGLVAGLFTSYRVRAVSDDIRASLILGSSLAPVAVAFMIGCALIADSALASARGTDHDRAPLGKGCFLLERSEGGVRLWRDYRADERGPGRKDSAIAERLVSVGQTSHYVYGEGSEGFFFWDTAPRTSFAVTSREDLEREARAADFVLSLQDPEAAYRAHRKRWIDYVGWAAAMAVIAGSIVAWVVFLRRIIRKHAPGST